MEQGAGTQSAQILTLAKWRGRLRLCHLCRPCPQELERKERAESSLKSSDWSLRGKLGGSVHVS